MPYTFIHPFPVLLILHKVVRSLESILGDLEHKLGDTLNVKHARQFREPNQPVFRPVFGGENLEYLKETLCPNGWELTPNARDTRQMYHRAANL